MADLIELIVSNSSGQISGDGIKGAICMKDQQKGFYLFYAVKEENDPEIKEIVLTMPVGGGQNGLLRLPRVGEKILVIQQGNQYFLMAYLPDTNDMEFRQEQASEIEANEITSSEALTLRYKSPNAFPKNDDGRLNQDISEIKISTQKTYWPKEKDTITSQGNQEFPSVDRVDVSSAGDMITTVQNYNEVNASRIGLFAGVQDELADKKQNYLFNSGTFTGEYNNGMRDLPLDNKDSSPYFAKGDVQVRADNMVVVKAKRGIVFQCGRSLIKMDDTGIKLCSAKIDPTYPCGDDSTISITSLNGVSVVGDTLEMSARISYSLTEQMGGTLTSFAGMTRMNTHNYRLITNSGVNHVGKIAASLLRVVGAEATMAAAATCKHSDKPNKVADFVANYGGYVSSVGVPVLGGMFGTMIGEKFSIDGSARGVAEVYDTTDFVLGIMNLIFTVKGLIYVVLDTYIPLETREKDGTYGDALSIVNLTIDYTLLEVMAIYTKLHDNHYSINYASIGANSNGITLDGYQVSKYCVNSDDSHGPEGGKNPTGTLINKAKKVWGGLNVASKVGLVVGGVLLGAGAAAGAAVGYLAEDDFVNADYLRRLQEL